MRLIRSLAAAAFIMTAATAAAFAHSKMVASTPEDGATVAAGLTEMALKFSHSMRLTLVRVRRAGDKEDVGLREALPKSFAPTAKVSVDALSAGTYDVTWTAVSQDGHVMKGHFAFTVSGSGAPQQ